MSNRRSLIEGINPHEKIDPDLAEDFLVGRAPSRPASIEPLATTEPVSEKPEDPLQSAPHAAPVAVAAPAISPLTGIGRVPVGARVRTELAAALKRASLERQLSGIQPNSVQEIIEDALELWLHKHGLLR